MRSRPILRAGALAVIALIVAVGCSSPSDDASDGSASTVSSSTEVEQAEASCPTPEEAERLAQAVTEQDDGPIDQKDIDNVIMRGEILRRYVPAEQLAVYDEYTAALVEKYRQLEGIDVSSVVLERSEPTPEEERLIDDLTDLSANPAYITIISHLSQACPGVVF